MNSILFGAVILCPANKYDVRRRPMGLSAPNFPRKRRVGGNIRLPLPLILFLKGGVL